TTRISKKSRGHDRQCAPARLYQNTSLRTEKPSAALGRVAIDGRFVQCRCVRRRSGTLYECLSNEDLLAKSWCVPGSGDVLFVTGLFVLGGESWNKARALRQCACETNYSPSNRANGRVRAMFSSTIFSTTVRGTARNMPIRPQHEPQKDSEARITSGLRPTALPVMAGSIK